MSETPDRAIAQAHDKFFKDQFQQLDLARSFLARTLPSPIAAKIAWGELTREDTSFIDDSLSGSACDLLFKTQYGERPAFIYILFEHQSTPDPDMPFRMLRYMVRIWERHQRAKVEADPPVIIPLVFHQGAAIWPYSLQFQDWLGLPVDDPLGRFQPAFHHLLLDLPLVDIRQLQTPVIEKLTLLLMKCVCEGNAEEYLDELLTLFEEYYSQTDEPQRIAVLLRYLFNSENRRGRGVSTVSQILSSLSGKKPNAAIMTIYDAIKDEGRQEGQSRGILIGRIIALQDLAGDEPSTPEELAAQNPEQLEARFATLKRRLQK